MKLLSVFLVIYVLDVFRVCQALTCTPDTANTCTKSKYVTGACKGGVCECIPGMVPGDFGCHKPFKPNLLVEHPVSFSGQVRPNSLNYAVMQCEPRLFKLGSYRWYRDGIEVANEHDSSWRIDGFQNDVEIRCAIYAYGALTEKSDPYQLEVIDKKKPFTKKPVVSGMPKEAFVDSTVQLSCDNKPQDVTEFQWHILGHKVPVVSSREFSLKLSSDKFNKPVTCTLVDSKNASFTITSHAVSTPSKPADDIPIVEVIGKNKISPPTPLALTCDFVEVIGISSSNVITYAWKGPDGKTIPEARSKIFKKFEITHKDSGRYSCEASYNNQPAKKSSDFTVTVFEKADVEIEAVPKKPVLGGYIALKCKVPGLDPSSVEFTWKYYLQHIPYTWPYLTDDVIQINNIDAEYILILCYSSTGHGAQYYATPTPISEIDRPELVKVNDASFTNSYVFLCNSDYETPGIVFEWFVNDVKQSDASSKKFGADATFTTSNITCRLSFHSNESSLSDVFSIPANGSIAPPEIKVEGQPSYFITGAPYTLTCSSLSTNENATYSWQKGDSDLGISTRSLKLSNIQTSDAGDYTCTITSRSESKQSKEPLKVVVTGDGKFCLIHQTVAEKDLTRINALPYIVNVCLATGLKEISV